MTARPRSIASEAAPEPTAVTRPSSTATHPSRTGGPAIERSHEARNLLGNPKLLAGPAAGRIVPQLFGHRRVAMGARGRERKHPRHIPFQKHRISEQLVMHVAPLRHITRVDDVADDLDLVHAVARAGGADDVFL